MPTYIIRSRIPPFSVLQKKIHKLLPHSTNFHFGGVWVSILLSVVFSKTSVFDAVSDNVTYIQHYLHDACPNPQNKQFQKCCFFFLNLIPQAANRSISANPAHVQMISSS